MSKKKNFNIVHINYKNQKNASNIMEKDKFESNNKKAGINRLFMILDH